MIRIIFSCLILSPLILVAQSDLRIVESKNRISLSNEAISLTIQKDTGRILELKNGANSFIAKNAFGYFTVLANYLGATDVKYQTKKEAQTKALFLRDQNAVFRIHVNTTDLIDVSFTPERPKGFPFHMAFHYVLRAGESGFHYYVVAEKVDETRDAELVQLRFGMRLNDSMVNIQVNDQLTGALPDGPTIANSKGYVMDATYALQSGETVTKYSWSSITEQALVHGLHNGTQGVWMITGGNEYLNGGPTKQHNTSHATDNGPIILKLLYSNHYGSRGSTVRGKWQKIFGPVFVYLNTAEDANQLWGDAKKKALAYQRDWPCKWLDHPEYPIERAKVTGRFVDSRLADFKDGWVVLAQPKEKYGLDWQQQGADSYIFRARIKRDRSFNIPAVRHGSYSLYAFTSGRIEAFRRDDVVIKSSSDLDLGTLTWPSTTGDILWRLGTPDRSAAEFRNGDAYRPWGVWYKYPTQFPNDVDFTIGKSREKRDWNYAHMAIWQEEGGWGPKLIPENTKGEGNWQLPTWKIRFHVPQAIKGRAKLTIALAAVTSEGEITVGLNGKSLKTVGNLQGDSAITRSGIRGLYRKRVIEFDASLLQQGENVITLDLRPAKTRRDKRLNYPYFGVMYDCMQLETTSP